VADTKISITWTHNSDIIKLEVFRNLVHETWAVCDTLERERETSQT